MRFAQTLAFTPARSETSCLAVYTDFSYRGTGSAITAELPFSLFVGQLAHSFDSVVALGRLRPRHIPFPFPVQERVGFVGLPVLQVPG